MRRLAPIAVAFVILCGLVAMKESRNNSADVNRADIVALAQPFTFEDARKFEITAPGGAAPAFTVVKEGDVWIVTAPFRAPASVGALMKLSEALAAADGELRSDDLSQLPDFDLTADRASTVRILGEADKVLAHVAIGRTSGARGGTFTRLLSTPNDTRALATTQDLRALIGLTRTASENGGSVPPQTPTAAHFQDKDFPVLDLSHAKELEITAPGRVVAFGKGAKGWERARGGPSAYGGALNAEGLSQIVRAIGPEFHPTGLADPADLTKLGLATPSYALTFAMEDGTTRRIFGAHAPGSESCYVRLDTKQTPDVVYECPTWEFQRLFPPGAGLFKFDAVPCPENTLTRVVIERATGERMEFTRSGVKTTDEWTVVAPAWPLAQKSGAARSLVSVLTNLRAVDWTDHGGVGEVTATLRFGKQGVDDASLTTVVIGGKAPESADHLARLPALDANSDNAMVLGDSTVSRILVAPLTLFEPRVFHGWKPEDVSRILVEPMDGNAPTLDLVRGEEGWTASRDGQSMPAKADVVSAYIAKTLALEVTGVAERSGATDSPPASRVTFERASGDPRVFVLLGSPGVQGQIQLGAGAFTADTSQVALDPASLE